jgi:hypothetical protein
MPSQYHHQSVTLLYHLVCGSCARLDTLPNGRHDDPKLGDITPSTLWKEVDPRTCILLSTPFQRADTYSNNKCNRNKEWGSSHYYCYLQTFECDEINKVTRKMRSMIDTIDIKWNRRNLNKNRHWRHCGRVVKAMDLKSIGVIPRRFEPCQCRILLCPWDILTISIVTRHILTCQAQTSLSDFLCLGLVYQWYNDHQ